MIENVFIPAMSHCIVLTVGFYIVPITMAYIYILGFIYI